MCILALVMISEVVTLERERRKRRVPEVTEYRLFFDRVFGETATRWQVSIRWNASHVLHSDQHYEYGLTRWGADWAARRFIRKMSRAQEKAPLSKRVIWSSGRWRTVPYETRDGR